MSLSIRDTIFALTSGLPPAGIAVVRITGPQAATALEALAGKLPEPRRAVYRALHDNRGTLRAGLLKMDESTFRKPKALQTFLRPKRKANANLP